MGFDSAMDIEQIREHWERAGEEYPAAGCVTPTSRDPFLGELEREAIADNLDLSHKALEVGCGDGFHSMHYARRVDHLDALDISGSLLAIARKRTREECVDNVEFLQGSVLDVKSLVNDESYDCIISQRCLINLPSWELQRRALEELADLLRPGGFLILSEGFQERLDNLNEARRALGLSEIKAVEYNRNLLEAEFLPFLDSRFDIVKCGHYGAYLFLSRVFHPLLVAPEQPRHDANINAVARRASQQLSGPEFERFSYNMLYVIQRR